MTHNVFAAMPRSRIASRVGAASRRLVYAAPGLDNAIATAILAFAAKPDREMLEVVLDCNDDVCRLGLEISPPFALW